MATPAGNKDIRREIRAKYAKVADTPENLFNYPTGRAGAEGLAYEADLIAAAPAGIVDGFCGVGNPFSIAPLEARDRVLDIGCGTGFDLYCASRKVGPRGFAAGIDLTPAMAARAAREFARCGIGNAQALCGAAEAIPFAAESFDIAISNGTLNLSPQKRTAFAEIFRVLRPGGRLQFADIVLKKELPEKERSARAWSE